VTAQVLFDFKARKPEELTLTKGEMLSNVRKVTDDWCNGKSAAGQSGNFPATYVVMIDLDNVKKVVVAKFDFEANKPDRISFRKGERVDVFAEISADWWLGRNAAGKTGLFPSSYIVESDAAATSAAAPAATRSASTNASARRGSPAADKADKPFTSATLKDFPIQFKIPSQSLPMLRIGVNEPAHGQAARSEAKAKLLEMSQALSS